MADRECKPGKWAPSHFEPRWPCCSVAVGDADGGGGGVIGSSSSKVGQFNPTKSKTADGTRKLIISSFLLIIILAKFNKTIIIVRLLAGRVTTAITVTNDSVQREEEPLQSPQIAKVKATVTSTRRFMKISSLTFWGVVFIFASCLQNVRVQVSGSSDVLP